MVWDPKHGKGLGWMKDVHICIYAYTETYTYAYTYANAYTLHGPRAAPAPARPPRAADLDAILVVAAHLQLRRLFVDGGDAVAAADGAQVVNQVLGVRLPPLRRRRARGDERGRRRAAGRAAAVGGLDGELGVTGAGVVATNEGDAVDEAAEGKRGGGGGRGGWRRATGWAATRRRSALSRPARRRARRRAPMRGMTPG